MNYNALFEDLAANNSRLFKIGLLGQHSDNAILKEIVRLALDPFTQFYIRKIPAYKQSSSPVAHLSWALGELSKLSDRVVTGNAAIAYLKDILESLNYDDAKVIERVIKKDLKCGVSVSTVNEIWPGLIHEYPCMLCSPFDEKLVKKIQWPAYVQMKMDGMRFNAIVKDGKCEFRSRNGKEINLLGYLEDDFVKLAGGWDVVFDGELLVMFEGDYQFADRQTGNGILNKAVKGTISDKEASQVHATLWDAIPLDDFKKGVCKTPYEKRYILLSELISRLPSKDKRIWNVASELAATQERASEIFNEYLSLGYEGIILKDKSSIWEDKRSKSQIKFKGEEECDLKIVGIQPGTGKYEGMIGAILCESSDGILKVDVGSGFKDEDRKKDPSEYLGKIAAIKYNMRIKNKQGEESLFLPVFLEVREDKTEADAIGSIK